MVKCTKGQVRRSKTALRWKMPPEQRQRIQMVLLRESGMCYSACNFGSSLFGGLRSSTFRPSIPLIFSVTRGPSLLFGISSLALPAWDQKDEAAQSDSRSDCA